MIRGCVFRRMIAVLLAVSFIQTPWIPYRAYAEENESELSQQDKQDYETLESKRPEFTEAGVDWAEEHQSALETLFNLAIKLEDEAKKFAEKHSEAELQELIDTNSFQVEEPGIGTVEYRMIEGEDGIKYRVPRVVLKKNDTAYLMLDESKVSKGSKHLQQYIARTHLESGSGRKVLDENGNPVKNSFGFEKTKSGRDLVIVSVMEGRASDLTVLKKPKPTQWRWWKEYFLSKYKKPTMNDFSMALVFGAALQGAMSLGMTALKTMHLGTDFSYLPAVFTSLYALGLGTFISTYRNWTVLSGTRFTRVLKSHFFSMAYAFGLVLFITPGDWTDKFAAVSLTTAAGLSNFVSVNVNALSNNYAKDYWNQIQVIRDKTRANAKTFKFNIFGKPVEWKQGHMEGQVLYMIPWSINIFSLMTIATTNYFQIPGTQISVPILQLAAIPFAMLWARWYSKRLAQKAATDEKLASKSKELQDMSEKYDQVWKDSFGMDIREIPAKIKRGYEKVKNACTLIFKKITNQDES